MAVMFLMISYIIGLSEVKEQPFRQSEYRVLQLTGFECFRLASEKSRNMKKTVL